MTEEHSNELERRLSTLESDSKHQSAKVKTMETRLWGLIVAVAVWAFNFISKKIGI